MKHPVVKKRNEKIKAEFEELYKQKHKKGFLYVDDILELLAEKYSTKNHIISSETVRKIVYSKNL